MNPLYYHYTSLNVLYSIVTNNELWLSNLRNSNDPNELYLTCAEYNAYVHRSLHMDPYHGRPEITSVNKVVGNPYGISFTSLEDELSQWERYGDRCRGVSIAFDILAMNEYLKSTYGFSVDFGAIKYTEEEKAEHIRELISQTPSYENYCHKIHWPIMALYFIMHYAQSRVLFKKEGFALEKEYRLYVDLIETGFYHSTIQLFLENRPEELDEYLYEHNEKIKRHHLTETDKKYAMMRNGINSYLSLDLSLLGPMKEHFIKEVVLGPKCMQNEEELSNFLQANGFSAVVRKSKNEII